MHAAVEAFHIPDSNVVPVHDEAASMMKAGRKMKEEFRLETTACSSHLLQTCIGHAIDSNGPISNLMAKARKLVGHFKHSALATTALCAAQSGAKEPLKTVKFKNSFPFRSYSFYGTVKYTEIFKTIQVYTQNASSQS